MKHSTLILVAAMALVLGTPAFAQRSHPNPGGPPAGRGPGGDSGMSGSHVSGAAAHSDTSLCAAAPLACDPLIPESPPGPRPAGGPPGFGCER